MHRADIRDKVSSDRNRRRCASMIYSMACGCSYATQYLLVDILAVLCIERLSLSLFNHGTKTYPKLAYDACSSLNESLMKGT